MVCRRYCNQQRGENLVSLLLKDSKERFRHTTKYLGSDDIVLERGLPLLVHDGKMTIRRDWTTTLSTRRSIQRTMNVLSVYGSIAASQLSAHITITTYSQMCCYSPMFSRVSEILFTRTSNRLPPLLHVSIAVVGRRSEANQGETRSLDRSGCILDG